MTSTMKKIAIIGTGISGMGAAYLLRNDFELTIYEKESRLGGHARTLTVDYDSQKIDVDTGFIVFNYRNYPHLTGMFDLLDVAVEKSDMSLGLSLEQASFEWGCKDLNAVFGQRRNLFSIRFWKMLRDIFRFNKHALAQADSSLTLGELLDKLNMSEDFKHRFLLPTAGAIWSTSPEQILDFPAQSFTTFFDNHGLLTINDQPQWHTVSGGSHHYVNKIAAELQDSTIRLSSPVQSVERRNNKVYVTDNSGNSEEYDAAIIATHSDQALNMLSNPTEDESNVLGSMKYQDNKAYLHRDPSFMPKRKSCWASWNYLCDDIVDTRAQITVTYWMNLLQNISNETSLFVTLNPPHPPREDLIFDEHTFEHPVYDMDMIEAQKHIKDIQGKNRLWFCGAYQRYGFHEDGILSAVNVAKQLGVSIPWE